MKAEIYVLGLFTFQGEDESNIVFSNAELNVINNNIEAHLGAERNVQESKWVTYKLNRHEILSSFSSISSKLTEAELGYYHHRAIFRFTFEGENLNSELRVIREYIRTYAINKISMAIIEPNRSLRFKHCDIYSLFIIKKGIRLFEQKEDTIYSDDTTTMAFDITEPSKISPIGKKYKIRISIPSTIIYTKSGVSHDFLKAMINSIYQYCLYEKKELNKQQLVSDIGERQLVHLWHHIIDTMGGRTLDKNMAKVSQTNYVLAFGALLIAIVAFDIEKLLYNWKYMANSVKEFLHILSAPFI